MRITLIYILSDQKINRTLVEEAFNKSNALPKGTVANVFVLRADENGNTSGETLINALEDIRESLWDSIGLENASETGMQHSQDEMKKMLIEEKLL